MTVPNNNRPHKPQIRRSLREHLVLPMLVGDGLFTLGWVVALIGLAL